MTTQELREKYIDFFEKRGHKKLPNVSLVPEDVSGSALFISAGMHPLIPFLLGEPHPLGKRLVSNQRCIRTGDIEQVGDPLHLTFFEMLGNWSLGDYWKEEQITWSLEFLTKVLKIPQEKISVSCFTGDQDAPKDGESAEIWQKLGIPKERIYFFGKKENWWGPVEDSGPCGPDSEMFIDTGKKPCSPKCDPSCQCGKYFEVWNDVFMQYNKTKEGKYEPLKQKNVDTGMGVERVLTIMQGKDDIFLIDEFKPIIQKIEKVSGKKYEGENKKSMRIIADHLRAATFAISDGVTPSNVERGYVLRRLIRRATDQLTKIRHIDSFKSLLEEIINIYKRDYPELEKNKDIIYQVIEGEKEKYSRVITKSLRYEVKTTGKKISGKEAFNLYATHGLSPQQLREQEYEFDQAEFDRAFKKHQEISRAGAEKKFAGGLADQGAETTKLHTATHLLHAALRQVLGKHVQQKGSNITPERLRFDFTHPEKLTKEELKKTENLINQRIEKNLPVRMEIMGLEEAKKQGALAFFAQKYGDRVKVYSIGSCSKEVCGGPHVAFTKEIGRVKITKSERVGSGVQRVYAVLAS